VNNVRVPPNLPDNPLQLAFGVGGELVFGLIMGLGLSLTFIAISWAGEIMGQQMGFNLAETFDPAMGSGGSLVGRLSCTARVRSGRVGSSSRSARTPIRARVRSGCACASRHSAAPIFTSSREISRRGGFL